MWYLVFKLFYLLSGWSKVCCLIFNYHREWRGVVKFDFCALLSRGWYFRDQWMPSLCSSKVKWDTQSSDDWEPVSVLPAETLLKRGAFIVTGSTGEKLFTGKKNFLRARDVEHKVSRAACWRQGVFFLW